MKKKILLVNCYRDRAEEKIGTYHEWLNAGAAAAGLELAVMDVNDRELPASGEDFAAVIVSGSQKMVGDGEIDPGLADFLRGNRRLLIQADGDIIGHTPVSAKLAKRVVRVITPKF